MWCNSFDVRVMFIHPDDFTGIGNIFSGNTFLAIKSSFQSINSLISNHLRINTCFTYTIFNGLFRIAVIQLIGKSIRESNTVTSFHKQSRSKKTIVVIFVCVPYSDSTTIGWRPQLHILCDIIFKIFTENSMIVALCS